MGIPVDLAQLGLVTLVVLIGTACQAVIGMGLNLLAIPILLMINPVFAPGPVLAASCVLASLALWRLPSKVEPSEIRVALVGLVAGTAVAGAIVATMDSAALTRLLGGLIVLGVILALSGWSAPITRRNLIVAGGGAGFLGTIAGVHAPPVALLYQGMNPARVRGAILTFVVLGNALSIVALAFTGTFGMDQIKATLFLAPGGAVGLLLAPRLARLIDAQRLRLGVLAISALSGMLLVVG